MGVVSSSLAEHPLFRFHRSMGENAIAAGQRVIACVGTSTAVFIGSAVHGSVNQPVSISGFAAFEQQFGGFAADLELGYAVQQFFLNGGSSAWVVRADADGTDAAFRQSIRALDSVDAFSLLALPGITAPAILAAAADYCRKRRAFLVVDSPPGARTPSQMSAAITSGAIPSTSKGGRVLPLASD